MDVVYGRTPVFTSRAVSHEGRTVHLAHTALLHGDVRALSATRSVSGDVIRIGTRGSHGCAQFASHRSHIGRAVHITLVASRALFVSRSVPPHIPLVVTSISTSQLVTSSLTYVLLSPLSETPIHSHDVDSLTRHLTGLDGAHTLRR